MTAPASARCFWTAPVRGNRCPWMVETRVSVKLGTEEVHGWDCCRGHVRDASQLALGIIHDTGRGTWHTDRYEKPARVKQRERVDTVYRPYLAIADSQLKSDMIEAQQSTVPRESMSEFIIGAIRARIGKGKGNVGHDSSQG